MTASLGIRRRRGSRAAWVAENQGKLLCSCGCAAPIPLKPEHVHKPPRFLHGHNAKLKPPKAHAVREERACGCGCGRLATPGRRFLSGHNGGGRQVSIETRRRIGEAMRGIRNPWFGKRPPNYRGWTITEHGYIAVFAPEHPFAAGGRYVMQHRLVVEEHLRATSPESPHLVEVGGRLFLRRDIEVHHDDGVKHNNAIENLRLMSKSEHAHHHQEQNRARQAIGDGR